MTLTSKHRLVVGFALIAVLGALLVWKHVHDRNISKEGTGVSSVAPPPDKAPPIPEPVGTPQAPPASANKGHKNHRETEILNGALRTPTKIPNQVKKGPQERQDEPKLSSEYSHSQVATSQSSPTPPKAASVSNAKSRGAAEESERLREQADKEKAELRAQLLQQLNTILATRDTARGLVANISDVLFKTGSYELSPGARERMARVSDIIAAHPGLHIEIEGHTDSVGNEEYNQQLSEERAIAVREYLMQHGVPPNAIVVRSLGKTNPIAANDTPEGRQQNRRVELILSGNAINPNAQPIFGTAGAPK